MAVKAAGTNTAGDGNRLLSLDEAAGYLAVKRRTLQEEWRGWGLTAIRVGRSVKFRVRDLDAWVSGNEEKGPLC